MNGALKRAGGSEREQMATNATILDVPIPLRANNITKHIISVDSRFRDSPATSTPADFFLTLQTTVRNILRVRITSIEFPNNYYIFTEKRGNVSLQILYDASVTDPTVFNKSYDITIPDGNYNAVDIATLINNTLDVPGGPLRWLSVEFSENTGHFTFTGTGNNPFSINTEYGSWNRPFDYGLGFNMGFSRNYHNATNVSDTTWTVVSNWCAYFAGDPYVFLCLNDFGCVRQTVQIYDSTGNKRIDATHFNALAKVILRDPKNNMSFDDYASCHAKEYVFPNPIDLTRLHVQILDPYGQVMDLCSAQWSFSIEVLEVKNSSLYNVIRDSISMQFT
jgi:hypothetical protein